MLYSVIDIYRKSSLIYSIEIIDKLENSQATENLR